MRISARVVPTLAPLLLVPRELNAGPRRRRESIAIGARQTIEVVVVVRLAA